MRIKDILFVVKVLSVLLQEVTMECAKKVFMKMMYNVKIKLKI